MTKGAILIGAGFTPTDEEVEVARIAGYIQNANAISRVYSARVGRGRNAVEQITSAFVLEQYARRLEANGWELPGNLQVFRLAIQEGREMLSVCPTSADPAQNSLPSQEELDTLLAQALTNPLQTFPILQPKKQETQQLNDKTYKPQTIYQGNSMIICKKCKREMTLTRVTTYKNAIGSNIDYKCSYCNRSYTKMDWLNLIVMVVLTGSMFFGSISAIASYPVKNDLKELGLGILVLLLSLIFARINVYEFILRLVGTNER